MTAVDSNVELKNYIAGDVAFCQADSYPIIKIGSGENDSVYKRVRCYNDRDKAIEKNLNPAFYRSYELDAKFPDDWNLEIQFWDRGYKDFAFGDQLIGSTTIDLEMRRFGDTYH